MKERTTPLMEKQILSEENLHEENEKSKKPTDEGKKFKHKFRFPEIPLTKLKTKFLSLKKPKFIIIFLLILIAIFTLIAFLAIASNTQKPPNLTVTTLQSPSPVASPDQTLEETIKEVEKFNQDLESIDTDLDELAFPEVDLDIDF